MTLKTFGNYSQSLALIAGSVQPDGSIANGVYVDDESDPGHPLLTPVNFITLGYADNANLDGAWVGGNQTKRDCTLQLVDAAGNAATVYQSNQQVSANKLPFVIRSIAPTVPILVFEGPRTRGKYKGSIISSDVNGAGTCLDTFELTVE